MTHSARVAELLEIEQQCDQFESLMSQGQQPDLDGFLHTVPADIRDRVRDNLLALIEHRESEAEITAIDELGSRLTETMSELTERYSLLCCVGRGGTAEVWKAAENSSGQLVAVKLANSATPAMIERFRREAETAGQLRHPRIPRVIEFGVAGRAFVVSQFIDGQSLESYIKRNTIDYHRAAEFAQEIALVIAYAHSVGVVHRDLKPQNILIDSNGDLFITDFGHAKELVPSAWDSLTRTGEILGTPAYMAPEQARGEGKRATETTDVYAIGVLLYRILMDEVPFRGNVQSVIYQILNTEVSNLRRTRPQIPIELDLIVCKCLQKLPGDRFASAQELADELKRFISGQPIRTKPITRFRRVVTWAGRNPRTAAMLAITAVLLIALSVGSTATAISLNAALRREQDLHELARQLHTKSLEARRDAEAAQTQAELNASQAQQESQKAWQIESFLSQLFESPDRAGLLLHQGVIDNSTAPSPTLEQIIQRGVERIHTDLSDQPAVQAHLLEILANASRVSLNFDQAQALFDEATALRNSPGYIGGASESLFCMRGKFYLARLCQDQGHLPEATAIYHSITATASPQSRSQRLLQADAYFQLATIHSLQFQSDAARELFTKSLQIRSQELPANSRPIIWAKMALRLNSSSGNFSSLVSELAGIEELPDQFMTLGMSYLAMKSDWSHCRYKPAIDKYEQIIEELGRELGPSNHMVFLARGEFAGLLYDAGDYRRAYPLIMQLLSSIGSIAPNNIHVLNAKLKIAEELMRGERLADASVMLEELAKSYRCIAEYPSELQLNLIWSRLFHGNIDGAREVSAYLVSRETAAQPIEFAWSCYAHARVLQAMGLSSEATTSDARALELARQQSLEHGAAWLERLSVIYSHNLDFEAAAQLLEAAVETETKRRGGLASHPRVARYLCSLASAYQHLGQLEASIECLEAARGTWETTLPADDPRIESTAAKILALRSELNP